VSIISPLAYSDYTTAITPSSYLLVTPYICCIPLLHNAGSVYCMCHSILTILYQPPSSVWPRHLQLHS